MSAVPAIVVTPSLRTSPVAAGAAIACPLCGGARTTCLRRMSTQELQTAWRQQMQIDVSADLGDCREIQQLRCADCRLRFFHPRLAGSGAFYADLQRFAWYYMPHKWEHDAALRHIKPGDRVLEVGCGKGDFVASLRRQGIDARGCELNEQAVRQAQAAGLPVEFRALESIVSDQPGGFDVICSFQVMEHVPHPAQMLASSLQGLRVGGRLIIAVPNCDGFIRLAEDDLMNRPPHHVLWWSREVFARLPRWLPVKLLTVHYEPMAAYHWDWFTAIHWRRVSGLTGWTGALQRKAWCHWVRLARQTGLWRRFRGHSIYVCYEKTGPCTS